jgi:hypothetical protein
VGFETGLDCWRFFLGPGLAIGYYAIVAVSAALSVEIVLSAAEETVRGALN